MNNLKHRRDSPPMSRGTAFLKRSKNGAEKNFKTRDTVHGIIEGTHDELAVINSPLMQRLKRVMQLSSVNQVFNGGTHSRFEHSLGAMHIAGLYMEHLFRDRNFKNICKNHTWMHYITVARLAALLHDVGHGPFSHSWDHVVGVEKYGVEDGGHDFMRIDLVKSKMLKPLIENCGVTPEELIQVWSATSATKNNSNTEDQLYHIIHAVVEGPLGADRIDFTLRDAKNTGTEHLGTIAHLRIITESRVNIHWITPRKYALTLAYNFKCIYDIISALDGRLYLYQGVYFHKAAMAASILIEKMIENLYEPLELDEIYDNPEQFALLDDDSILGLISTPLFNICDSGLRKSMSLSTDSINRVDQHHKQLLEARKLALRYKRRELPKMSGEKQVTNLNRAYDESEYVKKWFPKLAPHQYKIVKTRPVSGIRPIKFNKYSCMFYNGNELMTCAEALEKIEYTPSQKPYYLVRGYLM